LLSADQLSIASPWLSNQLQGLAGAQLWQRAGGLIATGAGGGERMTILYLISAAALCLAPLFDLVRQSPTRA